VSPGFPPIFNFFCGLRAGYAGTLVADVIFLQLRTVDVDGVNCVETAAEWDVLLTQEDNSDQDLPRDGF
jgi:hypothetical protein